MILFQKCQIYLKVKLMTVSIHLTIHHRNVKGLNEAENNKILQRINNNQKYVFESSKPLQKIKPSQLKKGKNGEVVRVLFKQDY